MTSGPAPADIQAAAARIAPHVRRTPILEVGNALSPDYALTLKLEHLQVTGSFKARGAVSLLSSFTAPTEVVAASGGNFGIAVAYAASRLGHRATVFVPETSPAEKIDRISAHGAEVRVIPGYYDDALAASQEHALRSGAVQAHAYDQPEVVAGQGTLGLELEDQTDVDVVICAVGGGGLIAGIANWLRDRATVVAAEPVGCRCLNAALEAGRPVEVEVSGVAVSSLGSRKVGRHCWEARSWIDDAVVVGDDEIVAAQRWLWSETRLVVEPAAATPIAALLTGRYVPRTGSKVVAVLSGGNVDPGAVSEPSPAGG
jgi:threonine dehydratase